MQREKETRYNDNDNDNSYDHDEDEDKIITLVQSNNTADYYSDSDEEETTNTQQNRTNKRQRKHNGGNYETETSTSSSSQIKRSITSNNSSGNINNRYNISSKPPGDSGRYYVDPHTRHQMYMETYLKYYTHGHDYTKGERFKNQDKAVTELDIIKQEHRFIWEDEDEDEEVDNQRLRKKTISDYNKKLAKKYYGTYRLRLVVWR